MSVLAWIKLDYSQSGTRLGMWFFLHILVNIHAFCHCYVVMLANSSQWIVIRFDITYCRSSQFCSSCSRLLCLFRVSRVPHGPSACPLPFLTLCSLSIFFSSALSSVLAWFHRTQEMLPPSAYFKESCLHFSFSHPGLLSFSRVSQLLHH